MTDKYNEMDSDRAFAAFLSLQQRSKVLKEKYTEPRYPRGEQVRNILQVLALMNPPEYPLALEVQARLYDGLGLVPERDLRLIRNHENRERRREWREQQTWLRSFAA